MFQYVHISAEVNTCAYMFLEKTHIHCKSKYIIMAQWMRVHLILGMKKHTIYDECTLTLTLFKSIT